MTKNDYLKRLGKCISNASVRGKILDEYEAHIDDCIEALMENGMSKKEAEAEAVRQMAIRKKQEMRWIRSMRVYLTSICSGGCWLLR